jgi:two-component system response regulator FixJ
MLHTPLEADVDPDACAHATEHFVYIVDDQSALRESSAFLLAALGIASLQYPGGREFLEDIPNLIPGCILLDVEMHEIDGLEVQAELKRRDLDWPIIFMSGHKDTATIVQAMKGGALEFLEKPFTDEQLLAALHRGFVRLRNLSPAA